MVFPGRYRSFQRMSRKSVFLWRFQMQMAVRLFNCSTRLATISFKLSKKIASAWDSKIIVPYNLFEINVASLDYVIWHELLLKWLLDNELELCFSFPSCLPFPWIIFSIFPTWILRILSLQNNSLLFRKCF